MKHSLYYCQVWIKVILIFVNITNRVRNRRKLFLKNCLSASVAITINTIILFRNQKFKEFLTIYFHASWVLDFSFYLKSALFINQINLLNNFKVQYLPLSIETKHNFSSWKVVTFCIKYLCQLVQCLWSYAW